MNNQYPNKEHDTQLDAAIDAAMEKRNDTHEQNIW